jgi:hypothetical protein
MLKAAHEAIAAGDAQKSGYELAISLFMGGLTSWAISRFGSQDLMTAHLSSSGTSEVSRLEPNSDENRDQSSAEKPPQAVNLLFEQVAGARDGLHAVRCVRLAVSFGEILDQLLTHPMDE